MAAQVIAKKLNSAFTTDLTDLVRGIRANKKDEAKYISDQLNKIREELRSPDLDRKANAVQKLTYLQMMGYDMSFAAFNVIEVMSNPKYYMKRVGYLAACQSFHAGTDVLMLATNLIKKDFTTKNYYDCALALNCLASVGSPDLARDLAADVVGLLNHSKPYIRKRAVLCLYNVFVKFPDALRPSFPRLKDKLSDPDTSVSSAAVNVICELARKNPKNYIGLSPLFIEIMNVNQANRNNWTLIKLIKLFGALAPQEQRLARLLVEPLHTLINSTPAMSLLYECIKTCIQGLSAHLPTMKLCLTKLRTFIEDADQNLKYLGLVALHDIMKIHPKAVAEHGDVVLRCLDDEDTTVRSRALDLLDGIASRKNLKEIVERLLTLVSHSEGTFRDDLIVKVVDLCHGNQYQHVGDFEWYITVITDLAKATGTKHGKLLASQFLDVTIRVKVVRPAATRIALSLLRDTRLTANPTEGGCCEVLDTAAFIATEFYRYTVGEISSNPMELIELLLQPRVAALPAHIQATMVQCALKAFSSMSAGSAALGPEPLAEGEEPDEALVVPDVAPPTAEEISQAAGVMKARLPLFTVSAHIEVQERACFALEIIKLSEACALRGSNVGGQLYALFEEALLPVAKQAQKKVKVPETLDLDTPFFPDELKEEEEEQQTTTVDNGLFTASKADWEELNKLGDSSAAAASTTQVKATRRPKTDNPYMLGGNEEEEQGQQQQQQSVDEIPVQRITENLGEVVTKQKKGSSSPVRKTPPKVYKIMATEEMPEGANDDNDTHHQQQQRKGSTASSASDALANVSLDEPLRPDEELPVQTHHIVANQGFRRPSSVSPPTTAATTTTTIKQQPKASSPYMLGGTSKTANLLDLGTTTETKSTKPQQAGPGQQQMRRLCGDAALEVAYELKTNPDQKLKVLAILKLTNKSSTTDIGGIQFSMQDTADLTMTHAPKMERASFILTQAQPTNTHRILLNITANCTTALQSIKGAIKYSLRSGGSATLPFELSVPCSLFITPVAITKDDLGAIIKNTPLTALSTTTGAAVESVVKALNLMAVSGGSNRLFYGTNINGVHVAVLTREKPAEGLIQVDLKCSDASLAASLISELQKQ